MTGVQTCALPICILTHNTGNCGVIDQSIPEGYEPTFKNGKYIANDGKHGSIRKGNISRNVPNLYGQYALDNCISFGGKARFAYNGKEVIQFYPGSGNMSNIYHGFYTDWRLINDSKFRNHVEHYFRL